MPRRTGLAQRRRRPTLFHIEAYELKGYQGGHAAPSPIPYGKILGSSSAPRGLTLATAYETLSRGGDQAIARWLERNPGSRMVVIDVFAKVRGTTPPGLSA
ncbi:hypothetical protein [Nonomuraea sp. CA-141351]|uniref:hypothetical protein n=1 Tax=Nonomuraea sp. CA-141351 TaxID=3239996 RepID=UPI003D90F603